MMIRLTVFLLLLIGGMMYIGGIAIHKGAELIGIDYDPMRVAVEETAPRPVPHTPEGYTPPGTMEPDPVLERERREATRGYTNEDFYWMRLNIYFEARNQVYRDKLGVGLVVMNRVGDHRYGNTVKEVITRAERDRRGNPIRNRCHFSWYCDGRPDDPLLNSRAEIDAWDESGRAAHEVLSGQVRDFTRGALYYHAPGARGGQAWRSPSYATPSVQVGHIFYVRN